MKITINRLIIMLIIPFFTIKTKAVVFNPTYKFLSVFGQTWFWLLLETLVFIILLILILNRTEKTQMKISQLRFDKKKSDDDYKLLFENMLVAIAVIQDNKIITVNQEMEKLTGYPRKFLIDLPVKKSIVPEDLDKTIAMHKQILETLKTKVTYDFRILRKDNEILQIHSDLLKIVWNNKPAILALLLDVTEKANAEAKIVESEEKFKLITENISDIIWVVNITLDKITYISPSMSEISGYSFEEMKTKEFKDFVVPEYYDGFMNLVKKNVLLLEENDNSSTFDRYEMQLKHRNGQFTWTETEMKFYKDKNDNTILICSTRNINSRKEDEEKINYLLNHDSLTGFKNRRSFEALMQEYDHPDNFPLTIIFSDVNGLKLANDIFGHNAGDELIQKSANALKKFAKENDVLARIGGDEFIALLPNTDAKKAKKIVADIKKTLSNEKVYTFNCNLSIGFDVKTDKSQSIETVKDNAESEMYKNKAASSKNFDKEMLKNILNVFYEANPNEKLHSEFTANVCERIGRKLNLTGNELYTLREAGKLHNIGRLPDYIKKVKVDSAEKTKSYPAISYRILNLFEETMDIADFIYQQKENWDGSGYPKGLKGNDISLISQILAISDYYVSLVSGHNMKIKAIVDAQKIINSFSGTKFNPVVVAAFNEFIKEQE